MIRSYTPQMDVDDIQELMSEGSLKSTSWSTQDVLIQVFKKLISSYPFISYFMYGMICLSPACIVPFWSGFISESLHPFLVSIVSSLFSILPIWKYLLDPTEQITLLSCFLMCQTVVLCTYFTNHPSWICEVIAAFLVTVSASRFDVICLLPLLQNRGSIFLTILAFSLWISNPYITILLLLLLLSTVYIHRLHSYQHFLLLLASTIPLLRSNQAPIFQITYSFPQQPLTTILCILLIMIMILVPCPVEMLILQVCTLFLPSSSFFALFSTALTPVLLVVVTFRFIIPSTVSSLQDLLDEVINWMKRNGKKRTLAWITLFMSILILVCLDLVSIVSPSHVLNMDYRGIDKKLTRQVHLEAKELINAIRRKEILGSDILKVTTVNGKDTSLWMEVVSKPETEAFYVFSSLPYHYLLFSPFDHNGVNNLHLVDRSVYRIVRTGNSSTSDLRYSFEQVYVTSTKLFSLYRIVQ